MFIELILIIILGIILGTFTGLTPGIHVNLIATILVSSIVFIPLPIHLIALLIITVAITHTFIDSIPSIYLGAPDESMILAVLPGHKLLLKGKGHEAIVLTVFGSFFCLILAIIFAPFFAFIFPKLYEIMNSYTGYILLILLGYIIFRGKKWIESIFFFILSGILGIISLNIGEGMILPLLSGLFGLSTLIISLENNMSIPKQKKEIETKFSKKTIIPIAGATGVGAVASFLPGFGSSQSAIVAQGIIGEVGDEGYLILTGGINTVNMALSLITIYTINKARNGAVIAMQKIINTLTIEFLILLFITILITGGLSALTAIYISKKFSNTITKIPYKKIVIIIISLITALSFYMTNITGIIILLTSTSIGIIASKRGIGKNNLMGCLLLPVLFFFLS
jgi:putative membrane protein